MADHFPGTRYVIRYGNSWLLTDDMVTKVEWVDDRSIASLHQLEWAEQFRDKMAKEFKTVQIINAADAINDARAESTRRLKSAYAYAFEAEIRRLAPDVNFHVSGLGCAAYWFGHDVPFANKVPVEKAAAEWLADYKKRNPQKFKKPAKKKAKA
jgi:hypothetical protein